MISLEYQILAPPWIFYEKKRLLNNDLLSRVNYADPGDFDR